MVTKRWTVDVTIDEVDRMTRAEAKLAGKDSETLAGLGMARCNPKDENVPDIGDELAVARALSDLSHQLLHAAAQDIESHTHQRVQSLRV